MEQEFLSWLRGRQATFGLSEPTQSNRIRLGIGDDAAVFEPGNKLLVIAGDSIAEGTHFDLAEHVLRDVGRKAIAVNLSDMAAMAATPFLATLSFQLPAHFSIENAQELYLGAETMANEFGVHIVGGDTNSWGGKLVVGANVVGETEHALWKMDGAKVGDHIIVTGEFGGSILGHHLHFQPQCNLAARIAKRYKINAATDVSDSLALDLFRVAEASGCGAEIILDDIPVSIAARSLAESRRGAGTALDHALYDGEDFQLILAATPGVSAKLLNDPDLKNQLTVIGTFVAEPGLFGIDSEGVVNPLEVKGYRH